MKNVKTEEAKTLNSKSRSKNQLCTQNKVISNNDSYWRDKLQLFVMTSNISNKDNVIASCNIFASSTVITGIGDAVIKFSLMFSSSLIILFILMRSMYYSLQ